MMVSGIDAFEEGALETWALFRGGQSGMEMRSTPGQELSGSSRPMEREIAPRQEGRFPDHFSHSSVNFSTAIERWDAGRSSNWLPFGLRGPRRRNMPGSGAWGSRF